MSASRSVTGPRRAVSPVELGEANEELAALVLEELNERRERSAPRALLDVDLFDERRLTPCRGRHELPTSTTQASCRIEKSRTLAELAPWPGQFRAVLGTDRGPSPRANAADPGRFFVQLKNSAESPR